MRKALCLEFVDRSDLGAGHKLRSGSLCERDVVVNRLARDTERRDHMAHNSAGRLPLFEYGDRHAGARQKIRRRDARRPAADNRGLYARCGGGLLHARRQLCKCALRALQLHGADVHGILIEIARTFVGAVMRADGAGDKRQRIARGDDAQRLQIVSLPRQSQICRDILLNRAAGTARRLETVDKRDFPVHLAAGQRLDRFAVIRIAHRILDKLAHLGHMHARKRLVAAVIKLFGKLVKALIAAGL